MKTLPEFFRPLLWSYAFERMEPNRHRETIIVQAVNYGSLKHWRWIAKEYGISGVREVLQRIPATTIRDSVRTLATVLFGVKQWNYAPRGTH